MPRKNAPHRIEFTEAASIDELIEALQELREKAGGGHVTRVTAGA